MDSVDIYADDAPLGDAVRRSSGMGVGGQSVHEVVIHRVRCPMPSTSCSLEVEAHYA